MGEKEKEKQAKCRSVKHHWAWSQVNTLVDRRQSNCISDKMFLYVNG
jgi:hypothetical protein